MDWLDGSGPVAKCLSRGLHVLFGRIAESLEFV